MVWCRYGCDCWETTPLLLVASPHQPPCCDDGPASCGLIFVTCRDACCMMSHATGYAPLMPAAIWAQAPPSQGWQGQACVAAGRAAAPLVDCLLGSVAPCACVCLHSQQLHSCTLPGMIEVLHPQDFLCTVVHCWFGLCASPPCSCTTQHSRCRPPSESCRHTTGTRTCSFLRPVLLRADVPQRQCLTRDFRDPSSNGTAARAKLPSSWSKLNTPC